MPSLRELQIGFADALRGIDSAGFAQHNIVAGSVPSERRVAIYRNNVVVNHTQALRITYPVVEKLVGSNFFEHAAARYIEHHPSASGDLDDYGGEFAQFLAEFPAAASLTYLPDVARLEWACQCVSNAAERAPLDVAALASIPPERYPELRFTLNPAARLLASDFPVHAIWQVNQPDYAGDQTVDLGLGGVTLLVHRSEFQIRLRALDRAEWTLLNALSLGDTFAQACDQAFTHDSSFDVEVALRDFVANCILVDFRD